MQALYLLKRELKSEIRNRKTLSSVSFFILTTVSIVLFSFGNETISYETLNSVFWISVIFTSFGFLSNSFSKEEDKETHNTLRLLASSKNIFISKIVYNYISTIIIMVTISLLFLFFFSNFVVSNMFTYISCIVFGALGISIISTICGAIVAKTDIKTLLFPILNFPLILPLLLILIKLTAASTYQTNSSNYDLFLYLVIYNTIVSLISYLLFEIIYNS